MNDPSGVRHVQCVCYVDGEWKKNFHFHLTPSNSVLQRHPIQKFHDDEWLALLLPDFVYRADVGMVESRGGLSLTPEPGQCLGVFGYVIR